MGFFSRLFDGNKQEKPDPTAGLPVKKQTLKGSAFFDLEDPYEERVMELMQRNHDLRKSFDDEEEEKYGSVRLNAEYEAEVEYVVLDENLLAEGIQEDPVDVALNEVFYVIIAEHNSITEKILNGDMEKYEDLLFDEMNYVIADWGLKAKSFKLNSIVPKEK